MKRTTLALDAYSIGSLIEQLHDVEEMNSGRNDIYCHATVIFEKVEESGDDTEPPKQYGWGVE